MKKIVLLLVGMMVAAGVFAQAVPQPAFRLLDGYLDRRTKAAEYGAKVGPWVLLGAGALSGVTAATIWYAGDDLAQSAGWSPMNHDAKVATTVGFGLGAAVLTGIGLALHWYPPTIDERANFSAIYKETDAALQEKLAAARLKSLSDEGRGKRLVSGWVNLAIVGTTFALHAQDNLDNGRAWHSNLLTTNGWEAGTILGAAASLLLKSSEEDLYDQYLLVVPVLTKE